MEINQTPVVTRNWKLTEKRKIFLGVLGITMAVVLSVLMWYIENMYAMQHYLPKLNQTTVTFGPKVISHDLHEEDEAHRAGYVNNRFLKLLNDTHAQYNQSNCWICAFIPHTHDKFPFVTIPVPPQVVAYILSRASIEKYPLKNLSWSGNRDDRNFSKILDDIGAFRSGINYDVKIKGPEFDVAPRMGKRQVCFAAEYVTRCSRTVIVERGTLLPYMGGTIMYQCGEKAYAWVRIKGDMRCEMVAALPPVLVRSTDSIHRRRLGRYERNKRQTFVVNQEDTSFQIFTDFGKGIIPPLGITLTARDIRRLSRVLEATINETAYIIANLTAEMQAIRLTAIQNRIALDYIMIKDGGVCKLFGSSCCVFVPDNAKTIYDGLNKLHDIAREVHIENGTGESWIMSLLRKWGWKLLSPLLILAAVIIGLCCCVQCFPICLETCVACCSRSMSKVFSSLVKKTVSPEVIMLQQAEQEMLQMYDYGDDTYGIDLDFQFPIRVVYSVEETGFC